MLIVRKLLILPFLAVVALCCTFAVVSADEWFDCANGVNDKQAHDAGVALCTKAIRRNQGTVVQMSLAHANRCMHLDNKGDYDAALRDCNRALELLPSSFSYNARGNVYSKKNMTDRALADYSSAIAVEPGAAIPHANRADKWLMKGEPEKALADYNKAIALAPRHGRMYGARANYYNEQGLYDKALTDTETAIRLKEESPHVFMQRAQAYFGLKQFDEAIRILSRVIDAEGDIANAYGLRAMLYSRLERFELAMKDVVQHLRINPNHGPGYRLRGNLHARYGNYSAAELDYSSAIRHGEPPADVLNSRAWTLFKTGNYVFGLKIIDEPIQANPLKAESWDTRGHLMEALGRKDEAVASFQKALTINPNLTESRTALKRLGY